jgi:hypothetical protein
MDAKKKILKSEEEKQRKRPRINHLTSLRDLFLIVSTQPPNLYEQIPDDLPPAEEQEPPPEDEWCCSNCGNSPCLFLQWQEELERIIDIMYPKVTIKAKR